MLHRVFILIAMAGFGICSLISQPQGSIHLTINGTEFTPAQLRHTVICLDAEDEFTLSYHPDTITAEQYVINGLTLYAQLSLGQPVILGEIPPGQPAAQPVLRFRLSDFLPAGLSSTNLEVEVIRATFRPGQILRIVDQKAVIILTGSTQLHDYPFMFLLEC